MLDVVFTQVSGNPTIDRLTQSAAAAAAADPFCQKMKQAG